MYDSNLKKCKFMDKMPNNHFCINIHNKSVYDDILQNNNRFYTKAVHICRQSNVLLCSQYIYKQILK